MIVEGRLFNAVVGELDTLRSQAREVAVHRRAMAARGRDSVARHENVAAVLEAAADHPGPWTVAQVQALVRQVSGAGFWPQDDELDPELVAMGAARSTGMRSGSATLISSGHGAGGPGASPRPPSSPPAGPTTNPGAGA